MKNLSSPRYRTAFNLERNASLILCGVLTLSPGQWVISNGRKVQFLGRSAAGIQTSAGLVPRSTSIFIPNFFQ